MGSRAQAISLLSSRVGADPNEVERMREGLGKDGWVARANLPPGWMAKERQDGQTAFLTADYHILKSASKALSYMRIKNFQQDIIDTFIGIGSGKRKAEDEARSEVKVARLEVKEKSEHCLADGWKEEGEEVVSPEGHRFPTRAAAVQWMIKARRLPAEIYTMWSGLEAEGWRLAAAATPLLPAGWRVRWVAGVADWYYLSRECSVHRSTEQARAALAASTEEFDTGALARFDQWAEELRRHQPAIAWVEEEALPAGWRVSAGREQGEVLLDAEGARFPGRKEAIDHMIREQHGPGEIFRLWTTLGRDGWTAHTALPTGWKRKFFPSEGRHHYLSPMMAVVRGTEAMVQVVARGEYTAEEKHKVTQLTNREETK